MKIVIQNYKSIISETLELDNNVTFIIGKNEAGKSNFISAINEFNKEGIEKNHCNFNNDGSEDVESSISFESKIPQHIIVKMKKLLGLDASQAISEIILKSNFINNESKSTTYYNISHKYLHKKLSKRFDINRIWSIEENEYIDLHKLNDQLMEFNTDENNFEEAKKELTEFIEINDEINKFKEGFKIVKFDSSNSIGKLESSYSYKDALESEAFLSLWYLLKNSKKDLEDLSELNTDDDDWKDLAERLRETSTTNIESFLTAYWNQKTIAFQIRFDSSGISIRAADEFEDKKKFKSLNYRSDGMKRYLALALFIEWHAKSSEEYHTKILLFDEPDNTLHATAVVEFKKFISSKKKDNLKFVIATHNPYFIDQENFSKINLVTKDSAKEGSKIKKNFAQISEKEEYSTLSPFIYKLGLDLESFLSLNNPIIFVEGFSDLLLWNSIKKEYGLESICFIMTGGAGKDNSLINLATSFQNQRPFFIFDFDTGGKRGKDRYSKLGYINQDNFIYANGEISDPNKDEKQYEIEDLFKTTKEKTKEKSSLLAQKSYNDFSANDFDKERVENIINKIKTYYKL